MCKNNLQHNVTVTGNISTQDLPRQRERERNKSEKERKRRISKREYESD